MLTKGEATMPSEATVADSIDILNKVPEFSDVAARHGPFFFGVFLVLVAVILILLNKNRYISGLFAVCGVLLMVWASLLYSGIGNPIHAYTMRLSDLKKNHLLVLADSVPRLYRHNIVHDLERDSCHIDLAAISPVKLEKGHNFKVIIKEKSILKNPDGTDNISYIKHKLTLPFKGEAHSVYHLEPVVNEDEEGMEGYQIVKQFTSEKDEGVADWLQAFRATVAHASDSKQPIVFSPLVVPVAESEVYMPSRRSTILAAEESDTVHVSVIYFKKAADKGRVETGLTRKQIPYVIKYSSTRNPSNACWIGIDVPSDVAQRIGLALLSEGVNLRYFGYFSNLDTRTNVVQISYSKRNANNENITKNDVLAFTKQIRANQHAEQLQRQQQQEMNKQYQKQILWQQQQQQQR